MRLPMAARQPYVTWAIIAANVIMVAVMTVAGGSDDSGVLLNFGAMFGPLISEGQYWRLFTAMFLHAGFLHLAFNMFGLWIFGRLVEGLFGHLRFVTIYLLGGLAGSVVSYLLNQEAIAVGASGAVFGILGATAAFFISQREFLGKLAQRNLYGILTLAGINLVFGFVLPGIDNWAHLGGLAGGMAIGLVLAPRYELERDVFGIPQSIVQRRVPLQRVWLVIPGAIVVLALGVMLGNAIQPETAAATAYKAEIALDEGDYERALSFAERAIELSPQDGRGYYARALVRLELGDYVGAESDAGKAIQFGDRQTRSQAAQLLVSIRQRG
ncbi:MAG: rhomboid family intramembrane serine protease [SAR202 cluster bacterium]|nr:rhomboid family intramembrane serine protease [SAR202 cluster bacterium]